MPWKNFTLQVNVLEFTKCLSYDALHNPLAILFAIYDSINLRMPQVSRSASVRPGASGPTSWTRAQHPSVVISQFLPLRPVLHFSPWKWPSHQVVECGPSPSRHSQSCTYINTHLQRVMDTWWKSQYKNHNIHSTLKPLKRHNEPQSLNSWTVTIR